MNQMQKLVEKVSSWLEDILEKNEGITEQSEAKLEDLEKLLVLLVMNSDLVQNYESQAEERPSKVKKNIRTLKKDVLTIIRDMLMIAYVFGKRDTEHLKILEEKLKTSEPQRLSEPGTQGNECEKETHHLDLDSDLSPDNPGNGSGESPTAPSERDSDPKEDSGSPSDSHSADDSETGGSTDNS